MKMAGSPKNEGFDWSFSNKSVNERLESGRKQMSAMGEKKTEKKKDGEPSGHLDTQLFPNRKPLYHE
jgi:hypothetical protein